MKILYVVNARIPTEKAHGVQIVQMCQAFSEEGHKVELVIPKRTSEAVSKYYALEPEFRITTLRGLNWFDRSYLGFLVSALYFAFSSYLYSRKSDADIIYTRDMDEFSFFTLACVRKPLFIEVHGRKDPTRVHRFFFKRINGAITTTKAAKRTLMENFKLASDVLLVKPNGVNPDMFNTISREDARKKLSLPQETKIALYAGHFYKWKDVDTIFEAAKHAPEILFILIGGTPLEIARLKREFSPFPINVTLKKLVPPPKIPMWLAAADCLLVTGNKDDFYSNEYTSPIKLYEYMAAQRPIAAVDTPSLKEAVSEEEVCFYGAGDARSLAQASRGAVEKTEVNKDRVKRAWKIAQENSWDIRAHDIGHFITRILTENEE